MKAITKAAFARRRGVSPPLVSKWIKAGLPVTNDGRIDVKAGETWIRSYTLNSEPEKAAGVETFGEARARKESSLASLRQLELEKWRGEVLDAEEVRDAVSGMVIAFRSKMLLLPGELCDKIAGILDPVTCRTLLEDRIHQVLQELSEYPAVPKRS